MLDGAYHRGIKNLVGDLNHLYCGHSALHHGDFEQWGFEWIDYHDAPQSVLSYLRRANDEIAVVILNYTPVPRPRYRASLPYPGAYREVLNSEYYAGSNVGNAGVIYAEEIPWMGQPYSIAITLPPLAGLVFIPTKN